MLNRRSFLKTFTYSLAGSMLLGKESQQWLVGSAHAATGPAGELRINLTEFSSLQNPNGSVRLALNPFTSTRANGEYFPIIVNRLQDGTYAALSSKCTHDNCVVNAFSAAQNACICFCHGSRFGIDGRRISGPASRNLDTYAVRQEGEDILVIEVPGLQFSVEMTTANSAAGNKVIELSFPTKDRVPYEILYRPNLDSEWTPVNFSASAEGPFNQQEIAGNQSTRTVFVQPEGQSGFYAVSVVVKEQ